MITLLESGSNTPHAYSEDPVVLNVALVPKTGVLPVSIPTAFTFPSDVIITVWPLGIVPLATKSNNPDSTPDSFDPSP